MQEARVSFYDGPIQRHQQCLRPCNRGSDLLARCIIPRESFLDQNLACARTVDELSIYSGTVLASDKKTLAYLAYKAAFRRASL
eukprot:3150785-Pyramimonas_sp.AAC.1